jgi:hypothetical protein
MYFGSPHSVKYSMRRRIQVGVFYRSYRERKNFLTLTNMYFEKIKILTVAFLQKLL